MYMLASASTGVYEAEVAPMMSANCPVAEPAIIHCQLWTVTLPSGVYHESGECFAHHGRPRQRGCPDPEGYRPGVIDIGYRTVTSWVSM